jgi:hypothetical protein
MSRDYESPLAERVDEKCECCKTTDEVMKLEQDVKSSRNPDYSRGDKICENCWMAGCNLENSECKK